MPNPQSPIREHVLALLDGGQAFDTFDDILQQVPANQRYEQAPGCGHSAWEVLEHLNLTLQDIVDYTDNADGKYKEKEWPREYWPENPPAEEAWENSRDAYLAQLERLKAMVETGDLTAPFPWQDHTLLREALLAAEHAAHHLGQIVLITRVLETT